MTTQQTNSPELFTILPGDPQSRVIIHVPHGGLFIPEIEIPTFTLQAAELEAEARLMADIHTDAVAREVYEAAKVKPWVFINNLSRLVVDPERFVDESEEMNSVGMGFAYEKTAAQESLREVGEALSNHLLATYFEPYSVAFAALTGRVLFYHGYATIIDLHSYAVDALPYELHKEDARPAVCLGVDDFHTHQELIVEARKTFEALGSVALNAPFKGTYVPLEFYGTDSRVQSIMLEIRKDTYGFGNPESAAYQSTLVAITQLIRALGSN